MTVSNALKASKQHYEVIVVEDSRGDAGMIVNVLRQGDRDMELVILTDGAKAAAYLSDERPADEAPLGRHPDLIFLDLDLPHLSGYEVLRQIRAGQRFHSVPVVVFTASQRPDDVRRIYELGGNALVYKPIDFEGFVRTVRAIEHFWLDGVASPDFKPRT